MSGEGGGSPGRPPWRPAGCLLPPVGAHTALPAPMASSLGVGLGQHGHGCDPGPRESAAEAKARGRGGCRGQRPVPALLRRATRPVPPPSPPLPRHHRLCLSAPRGRLGAAPSKPSPEGPRACSGSWVPLKGAPASGLAAAPGPARLSGPCPCPTSTAPGAPQTHRACPGSAAPLENTASCPCPAPALRRPGPRGAETGAAVAKCVCVGWGGDRELAKLQTLPEQARKAQLECIPPPQPKKGGKNWPIIQMRAKVKRKLQHSICRGHLWCWHRGPACGVFTPTHNAH